MNRLIRRLLELAKSFHRPTAMLLFGRPCVKGMEAGCFGKGGLVFCEGEQEDIPLLVDAWPEEFKAAERIAAIIRKATQPTSDSET